MEEISEDTVGKKRNFIGPQIRGALNDIIFVKSLSQIKLLAWLVLNVYVKAYLKRTGHPGVKIKLKTS